MAYLYAPFYDFASATGVDPEDFQGIYNSYYAKYSKFFDIEEGDDRYYPDGVYITPRPGKA